MPFFLAGTIFAIFGIIKMLTLPKILFYTTGEEPLMESTLYFEGIKRDCILALLDKGEFSKLKSMAKQNSNLPIKVEMHETVSGSIVAYRVYSFIPYTYEPITDFLIYKKP